MNFITKDKFDSLGSGKITDGDLVYCLRGATFGKTAFVTPYKEGAIASSLMIIRPFKRELDRYIYRYLTSPFGRSQIFRFDNGSAQPNLSANSVKLYAFPVPPLNEQHRIVAKIDELMALCDQLEREQESSISAHQTLVHTLLTALTTAGEQFDDAWVRIAGHFDILFTTENSIDQLKQSILQLAVMGKLVPQNPEDEPASVLLKKIAAEKARLIKEGKIKKQKPHITFVGLDELKITLPNTWEWIRLSDTADIVRGGSPRPAGDPKFYDGDIPFLKVKDITNNKGKFVVGYNATIKEAGLHKTRYIDKRTVLLSNSGATLGIPEGLPIVKTKITKL